MGGLDETTPETLRRMNREARMRRLREEMAKQEEDRRERERMDYEYAQLMRRQQEEQRRAAQEAASASAASSSSHPTAAAVAFSMSDPRLATMVEQMLRQARMGSLLTPRPEDIDIQYLLPQQGQGQQGIMPQPPNYFAQTPFRLPEDAMTDAPPSSQTVKRRSTSEPTSPKGKARIDEPEGESSPQERSKNPVKKTEVKQDKVKKLEDDLSEVLLDNSADSLRQKFSRRFPDSKSIPDSSGNLKYISKANKSDISREYIRKISALGTRALASETRQLKEEKARLSSGSASAST
jgi:hypothetical protein